MDVKSQADNAYYGGVLPQPQNYAASEEEQEMMNVLSPPRAKESAMNIMPDSIGKHSLNGSQVNHANKMLSMNNQILMIDS